MGCSLFDFGLQKLKKKKPITKFILDLKGHKIRKFILDLKGPKIGKN